MPGHEPGRFHVVADLDAIGAEHIQKRAMGNARKAFYEDFVQHVAITPHRRAFSGQLRQRFAQQAREFLALHIDTVFP